jgi:hypothetical protein
VPVTFTATLTLLIMEILPCLIRSFALELELELAVELELTLGFTIDRDVDAGEEKADRRETKLDGAETAGEELRGIEEQGLRRKKRKDRTRERREIKALRDERDRSRKRELVCGPVRLNFQLDC